MTSRTQGRARRERRRKTSDDAVGVSKQRQGLEEGKRAARVVAGCVCGSPVPHRVWIPEVNGMPVARGNEMSKTWASCSEKGTTLGAPENTVPSRIKSEF